MLCFVVLCAPSFLLREDAVVPPGGALEVIVVLSFFDFDSREFAK